MSDDNDDKYKSGRRWDDRRGWYDPHERPTVISIFSQLGYNLWNQDDVNRLRDNLEFAEKIREREETIRSRRLGWFVSAAIAILSTIFTVFGEWIVSKMVK